jgi:hypothetical protein
MNQNDDAVFAPDDGTPLHALAELRRAMGDRYDKASGEVLHAVDRAHSAVIQADSAKSAQEEMRHLIRALATVSEVFILTPKKIQETYRDVLDRLQRQVETLAVAIPAMPPTPDQLAARIDGTTGRVDRFLSRCEVSAANLEKGLTAQVAMMTDRLRATSEDLGREARSVATQRHNHDLWVFLVGVLLGTLMAFGAARVWGGWSAPAKPKVSVGAASNSGVLARGVWSRPRGAMIPCRAMLELPRRAPSNHAGYSRRVSLASAHEQSSRREH